jgi:hypothetical protein
MQGPDVPDYDFKTKYEFSCGKSEIDDMEILKHNIVKCIEVVKIPENRYERVGYIKYHDSKVECPHLKQWASYIRIVKIIAI